MMIARWLVLLRVRKDSATGSDLYKHQNQAGGGISGLWPEGGYGPTQAEQVEAKVR